jgi:hypothetical protein
MALVIESGIGTLNYGKQSAKGTKAVAATTTVGYNQPKLRDGQLSAKKTLGSEEFIDGRRFASPTIFTDTAGGAVGSPVIQAQPENAGLYFAQILGVDTSTGAGDPWTHTITSAGTSGAWGTWWEKTGVAVGPNREVYWDTKIAKLTMECGVQQKPMHLTMDLLALVPAEVYVTDPAKTQDLTDPFLWTEMTGAMTFDGTVISEVEGEVLEIDTKMEPFWGDNILPAQLIEKKGSIVRTINTIVTDATLQKYYKAVYNNTAPGAGTQPVKNVFQASVTSIYTRSATRTLTVTTPSLAVDPANLSVDPQPEGGKIPLSLTGMCQISGASPALTVIALTGDSSSY